MRSNGGVMPVPYVQNGYPNASGDNRRHKKRPDNTGSKLLTIEENTALFNLIGTNCVSLAAGVCQLFRAEHGCWRKVSTGVVSLVKDYNQKAYCLRIFNLQEEQLIFQQHLYQFFRVKTNPKCTKFLVFEGDVAVYGLNFAEDSEANDFSHHLQKRYEQELRSNSPLYFYDFHLRNQYSNTKADGGNPQNYRCGSKENFTDRLYDNVPRLKADNLSRSRSASINSAYLEQDLSFRPIAEVKPFFVYSTTEQAVASAEKRLYDAVSTLTRRRAAVTPTPKTYSTPMTSRRNTMTPQPVMGTGRNVWGNDIYGYSSPGLNRSVSVNVNQHDVPYSISRQNSTVGVTIGRRSFYPVYRGCDINSPPAPSSFTPIYRAPMDDFMAKRYPPSENYFPNRPKEMIYGHSYLDNNRHMELNNFVHNSQLPSHYAMFSSAASRMHSGDRTNKVFDSPEWTHHYCYNNNSLSVDDFASVPAIDTQVRQTCRSCSIKGVDCVNGGGYGDIGQKRKQSKSSPPLNRVPTKSEKYSANNRTKDSLPPYDSLYSVSNIAYSSSSSAYSSGSTPPEPAGELSINTNDKVNSTMLELSSYPKPISSNINVAPPRPDSKPKPPKTIAAVSPNHVSTVNIPEYNDIRPTSTIPFEKSLTTSERPAPKRYFTLRPTKPPPPPPHQNLNQNNRSVTPPLQKSCVSASNTPLNPRKIKKHGKSDIKRAHSKITLVENFFHTDRSQPNGSSVGITSIGAVSHINNVKHLEEGTKSNNKKGKKKDKKQKIRKEDIGNPINFQHKAHIGWDQDGGFSQQMFDAEPMDDSVRALLTAAGQNPDKMKPDDIKFVYKFLESWDANESKPTPKYTSSSQYPTPPSTETTRIPVASYESRSNRPLPSKSETPLPKASGARANLLAEIHAGARLKHIEPPAEKSPINLGKVASNTGNARDDVMNAIKQGTNLRHVNQSEVAEKRKSITATQNLDGIAGALARALEKRRNQMNQSDSEDGDESGNEWEDD